MNWYLEVLKKYVQFSGRARRSEYWYFTLVSFIISLVFALIDHLIGLKSEGKPISILGSLYGLAVFLPSLGVSIRRLHDTGRSGWWLLISFVPLIGGIVLLVFDIEDSHLGVNQYGENPKEIPEAQRYLR